MNIFSRSKSTSDSTANSKDFSARVLWDVSDGAPAPIITKDSFALDRRSFLTRISAAAMALIGFAAVSSAGSLAQQENTSDSYGQQKHTDSPHNDQTGHHTDITCDPPQCTESHHADGTPHSDRAHIDS